MLRAPSPLAVAGLLVGLDALLAAVVWRPDQSAAWLVELWVGVFVAPALVAAGLTGPVASALGGRLGLRRSLLLALTATIAAAPLLLLWRAFTFIPFVAAIPSGYIL